MKRLISIIFLVSLTVFFFVINTEATEQPAGLKQPDSILESFKIYNPSLPVEIGRLPDYQGNIEGNRLVALNRLYSIIENTTPEQVKNLEIYLNIGVPEKRSYCTPLQALLWVLEKEDDVNVLNHTLTQLLDKAWVFSEANRWQDYEVVSDRLNAPELVNYYQRVRFVYISKKGKAMGGHGEPKKIFVNNSGNCDDTAAFAAYCLKKAGYENSVKNVHPTSWHTVCVFKYKDTKYIIDNGRPDKFLRRGILPADEYKMYQDQVNLKKAEGKVDKEIYTLQDNHGLLLVYLIQHKGSAPEIKSICEDLGLSGYEEKVEKEYFKVLVSQGFIINIQKTGKEFNYSLNNSLCEAFLAERYHRPQNAAARW
jgi:hypothetical protein